MFKHLFSYEACSSNEERGEVVEGQPTKAKRWCGASQRAGGWGELPVCREAAR